MTSFGAPASCISILFEWFDRAASTGIAAPGSELRRPAAHNERAINSFMISFVPP